MCVHAHTCNHVDVLLFQYGPYSDVSEITTAAGPPGQCRAPCISFTPDGCVLVSWEVSQTCALHYFLFLWLYLPRMHVRRKLFKAQIHYRWLLHVSLPWHLLVSFRVVEILPLIRMEGKLNISSMPFFYMYLKYPGVCYLVGLVDWTQCRFFFLGEIKFPECPAFQSPESSGADISEYRLEWGEDEESLELVYHGTDPGFAIRDLLPAAQYCCRLQVGRRCSDLPIDTGVPWKALWETYSEACEGGYQEGCVEKESF